MFVELEAPVCWVGHHANENWKTLNYRDSTYYPYILQANMETIHFYRNHPSVLFWSMANESYWNKGFAQVEVYVEKADPTRPHTSMTRLTELQQPGEHGSDCQHPLSGS